MDYDEIPKFDIKEYFEQWHGVHNIYRSSGYQKIRCPFHGDREASGSVDLDRQRFKCFGCPAEGDVIDLIMYGEGVEFEEALSLAEGIAETDRSHVSGSADGGDYGFRIFS